MFVCIYTCVYIYICTYISLYIYTPAMETSGVPDACRNTMQIQTQTHQTALVLVDRTTCQEHWSTLQSFTQTLCPIVTASTHEFQRHSSKKTAANSNPKKLHDYSPRTAACQAACQAAYNATPWYIAMPVLVELPTSCSHCPEHLFVKNDQTSVSDANAERRECA